MIIECAKQEIGTRPNSDLIVTCDPTYVSNDGSKVGPQYVDIKVRGGATIRSIYSGGQIGGDFSEMQLKFSLHDRQVKLGEFTDLQLLQEITNALGPNGKSVNVRLLFEYVKGA